MSDIEKMAVGLSIILALTAGYLLGGDKPVIKETQYILQKCEPSDLDWDKYRIQKQKDLKELCPNGGQWTGDRLTMARCYDK